jgi:N-methylhydantoinase A
MSSYLVGIDVGGTFTDAVAYEPETGALRRAKVATTADQSEGTLRVFEALGIEASSATAIYHGFTVGLNAVLTRSGAKTGLLCTMGFRDLMDIGRVERPFGDPLYDPHWMRPHQDRPIVERRHRREIPGRQRYDGAVHEELDLDRVRAEARFLAAEGVEAVAVCLLNAYASTAEEDRVLEIVREVLPAAYVQSSRVLPIAGEFERTFAVCIDAYTGAAITRYLTSLNRRIRQAGHHRPVQVMQMNGGLRTIDATLAEFPALTLSSGPVAGAVGAEYYARNILGVADLVCVDVGGTSTDLAMIQDGAPAVTENWEIEQAMPLGLPTVDVRSIGAGGGSLVRVDHVGTLTVGPDSAGAQPGPVGYGHGGAIPTLTDAYITLGYVAPELFLGGTMKLDVDAARVAVAELGATLHTDTSRVAAAIVEHVSRDIVNAIRRMAFDNACDLTRSSLFAYGGAGPLHAVEVARALQMPEAIVPFFPGGFSAVGMIVSKPKVERLVSPMRRLSLFSADEFTRLLDDLEDRCRADLAQQFIEPADTEIERFVSVMYAGQSFDNRLRLDRWPLPPAALDELRDQVDAYYQRVYGYSGADLEVVITKLSVTAVGTGARVALPAIAAGTETPEPDAVRLRRDIVVDGAVQPDTPFYLRDRLRAGNVLDGPAIVDDALGTTLLPPGSRARVDRFGTLRITWDGAA